MSQFTWLHLTDLHFGLSRDAHYWPNIKQALLDNLACTLQQAGPVDAVFFSGDLVQEGKKDEFARLDEQVLDPLFECLGKFGRRPYLLAVPGNHDLTRPNARNCSAAVRQLVRRNGLREIADELFGDGNCEYRDVITNAFANYAEWWKNHRRRPAVRDGLLPGEFSVTCEVGERKIAVIGLNTAFLQLQAGNFERRLALDPRQFHAACTGKTDGDSPAFLNSHDAAILMTHHGPDWLDTCTGRSAYAEINPAGRFAVHLFGHMHENVPAKHSDHGGKSRRLWQGNSFFGSNAYGVRMKFERRHGYAVGRIHFNDSGATIRQFPVKAYFDPTNGWRFDRDVSTPTSPDPIDLLRDTAPRDVVAGVRDAATALASTVRPGQQPCNVVISSGKGTISRADYEHLPGSQSTLLGREDELAFLDNAWAKREIRVVSLRAGGGVGKSALVRHWLETMRSHNFRGASRVYGWSFYSQGIGDRVVSAEPFVNYALDKWFGDTFIANSSLSSWDKGRRLAEHLQKERVLLILDGLEPLQSPLAGDRGRIRDLAITSLLRQLMVYNPGLCVVTTREPIRDLRCQSPHAKEHDLEEISNQTARRILRAARVTGDDAELERISNNFGNHAMTITLLGAFLSQTKGRNVANASQVSAFGVAEGVDPAEKLARQTIAALASRFNDEAAINVLHVLGLFDRPVTAADLRCLRIDNNVRGLTDRIHSLNEQQWENVLDQLRMVHLLLPRTRCNEGGIDAHPIVRAHFRWELQRHLDVWRMANSILYDHYSALAEAHRPDNLREMEPLYRAIDHGCNAGRYQEALDDILIERLRRGHEHYSFFRGYLGEEMTALSRFFRHKWTEVVDEPQLDALSQAWLLNEAGSVLRVSGCLSEAISPIRKSIRLLANRHEFMSAGRSVATLVNVYMLLGNLSRALYWAKKGVEYVDKSKSTREQIAKYSLLAHVYLNLGRTQGARKWTEKAMKLQADTPIDAKLKSGLCEVIYCELLADQGEWGKMKVIAQSALHLVPESNKRSYGLVLSMLGRADVHLALQNRGELREGKRRLDDSVDMIRETGRQDELPQVLVARARCLISVNELDAARGDLDEAYEISSRLGMRLHEATACLGYAWLQLHGGKRAANDIDFLQRAREIVRDAKYYRYRQEVAELGNRLMQSDAAGAEG